jgi:membrane peptidoglycan carboxypeptidase
MRELLKTVSSRGTGAGYGVSGFSNFSKAGTTTDDYDRWYVGGTPYYVAACWYGYDIPKSITNTSGNPAGKLFKKVMDNIHDDLDKKSFPSSSGVVTRRYCRASGNLATPSCGSTAVGYYRSNNLPKRCQGCNITNPIGQGVSGVVVRGPSTDASDNKATSNNKATTKNNNKTTTKKPTQITTKPDTQATTQSSNTTSGTTIQQQVAAAINGSVNN